MPNITKAYEIRDAKIRFVSLVDKAANKHQFLITKSSENKADFQTFGKIVKKDIEKHYVTGIVYEPMTEDTDGNYMTEEEITKAAHWFMKNAGEADIQHCFEKAEGVEVVESYVAKCDMEIEGQSIKKGTWLMTVEVTDANIWKQVEKGEITGFSMGGTGVYSDIDVGISDTDNPVEKKNGGCASAGSKKEDNEKKKNGKGILKQLASMFGMDVIEKGTVKDNYKKNSLHDNFWTAYYELSDYLLYSYNPETGCYEPIRDESIIREALSDFNEIITELLASDDVFKSVIKSRKQITEQNKATIQNIHKSIGSFISKFEEEEDGEVKKSEVEQYVTAAIAKALNPNASQAGQNGSGDTGEEIQKGANDNGTIEGGITADDIEKMVKDAIQKTMQPEEEKPLTKKELQQMIEEGVAKAMEPVMKSTGLPTNLNDTQIQKNNEEEHYLHGLL